MTARLEIDDPLTNGVVVAQGGRFGGWSLFFKHGRTRFAYNFLGVETYTVASDQPIARGGRSLALRFIYDGGGVGRGGMATIFVDDDVVGTNRIDRTIPYWLGPNEALGLGRDHGTPVTDDYVDEFPFGGQIHWVRIDLDADELSEPCAEAAQLPRQ